MNCTACGKSSKSLASYSKVPKQLLVRNIEYHSLDQDIIHIQLLVLVLVICYRSRAVSNDQRQVSLVPRPSTPPVFDRLLYAKMEGEGTG